MRKVLTASAAAAIILGTAFAAVSAYAPLVTSKIDSLLNHNLIVK